MACQSLDFPANLSFSVASSKHLQTRRFLDTLQSYLFEIQRLLVQLYLSANEHPAPFVDHSGVLRDSKTGRAINGGSKPENGDSEDDEGYETMRMFPPVQCVSIEISFCVLAGYSFFDSGDIELLGGRKRSAYANIGAFANVFARAEQG